MTKFEFLTFSNRSYMKPPFQILKQASDMLVFDKINFKTEDDISEFNQKHSKFIQQNPHGYGLWIWKPKVILDQLMSMEDDDILVYADLGTHLNKEGIEMLYIYFKKLTDEKYSFVVFDSGDKYQIRNYVKMDAIMHYLPSAKNSEQTICYAGIMIIRKNKKSISLLEEWLELCENYNFLERKISRNHKESEFFIGNECDNGLFNLCVLKYSDIIYRFSKGEVNLYHEDLQYEHLDHAHRKLLSWKELSSKPFQVRRYRPKKKFTKSYTIHVIESNNYWVHMKNQFELLDSIKLLKVEDKCTNNDVIYKHIELLNEAHKNKLPFLIIMEDDIILKQDFEERFHILINFLENNLEQWSIFNGNPTFEKYETTVVEILPLIVRSMHFYFSSFVIYNVKDYDQILKNITGNPVKNYEQITCVPYLTETGDDDVVASNNEITKRISKNFIFLEPLEGSLGDILFQIFASYGVAKSKNIPLVVHTKYMGGSSNKYMKYFYPEELLWFIEVCSKQLKDFSNKKNLKKNIFNITQEYAYTYKFPIRKPPFVIYGYMQHKEYFDFCRKDIHALLRLGYQEIPLEKETFNCGVVMGLNNEKNIQYFSCCMDKILEKHPNVTFHVFFGNDIKEYLEKYNCIFHVENNETLILSYAASMNSHITNDSTLSWWAAYLSNKNTYQSSIWKNEQLPNGLLLPGSIII